MKSYETRWACYKYFWFHFFYNNFFSHSYAVFNIYFKSLYNQRDDWENRWRLRADDPGDKGENTYRVRKLSKGGIDNDRNKNTRLEAQQSSQYSFGGEHFFGKLGVDWKASYSKASEERPDERILDLIKRVLT